MRVLLAICLVLTLAPVAGAQTYTDAIVLGEGYATGPPGWIPWITLPDAGDPLLIAGPVTALGPPLDSHPLPPAGTYELTYAFAGYECIGTGHWDDFENGRGGEMAIFNYGTFSVYLDTSPDGDVGDLSTFQDGEMILQATIAGFGPPEMDGMWLYYGDPFVSMWGYGPFIGGTWFEDVSSGDEGYAAGAAGQFTGDIPAAFRDGLGYVGKIYSTSIRITAPIATETTTWGKVKALYR